MTGLFGITTGDEGDGFTIKLENSIVAPDSKLNASVLGQPRKIFGQPKGNKNPNEMKKAPF